MLEGIKIKPLKRNFDERGSFTELMRKDWKEIPEEGEFVQANLSVSYPAIMNNKSTAPTLKKNKNSKGSRKILARL